MSDASMTCSEAEPLLPLVADGAIDPSSDPALFAHLASCPVCQRTVASHDLITIALKRSGPQIPARTRVLTFPRLAAAALLVCAFGTVTWLTLAPSPTAARLTAPVAVERPLPPAPVAVIAAKPTPPPSPEPPTVLRVTRTDGSAVFLVRRGDAWVMVDPAQIDESPGRGQAAGENVPVRW